MALLEEVEHLKRQLQLAQKETSAVKADAAVDENQLRESLDALRSELKEEAAAHAKDTATLEQVVVIVTITLTAFVSLNFCLGVSTQTGESYRLSGRLPRQSVWPVWLAGDSLSC